MKILFLFVFSTLLAVSGSYAALDIPGVEQCDHIVINRSEGSELSIHRDGSATLGFGALSPHAKNEPGVFDFRKVYSALHVRMVENRKRAEEPYVAVGFTRRGESGTRMFFVYDEKLVSELFARAERHSIALAPFGTQ